MKFKATLLSLIFIFATIFASARSFTGKSVDCCKTSHCDTKKKEKGCDQKENCANFCCVCIIAVAAANFPVSQNFKELFFPNKILFRNDGKINNNGLPFFHPPSQI